MTFTDQINSLDNLIFPGQFRSPTKNYKCVEFFHFLSTDYEKIWAVMVHYRSGRLWFSSRRLFTKFVNYEAVEDLSMINFHKLKYSLPSRPF